MAAAMLNTHVLADTWLNIVNFELLRGNPVWRFGLVLIIILLSMAAARTVQFIIQSYASRIRAKLGTHVLALIAEAMAKPVYVAIFSLGIMLSKMPLYFDDDKGIRTAIGTGWTKMAQVVAAIAYCKTPEVEAAWRRIRPDVPWPFVTVLADVCRQDLLFEVEATACPGVQAL